MLSNGCVSPQYGGTRTNPLACANLNLPHYVGGSDGWHVNIGWVIDHPIVSSLIVMILLTMAKSLNESRKAHQSSLTRTFHERS